MFYPMLGRLTWMVLKRVLRRRVSGVPLAQKAGAAAVVLAVVAGPAGLSALKSRRGG